MNPLKKIWFWLLLLSIIALIVAFVLFETQGQTTSGKITTPFWVWGVFIAALVLFIIAMILYLVDVADYHRKREIAEACGEIIPITKKKIECPKNCVKKEIVECSEKLPCSEKKTKIVVSEQLVDRPTMPQQQLQQQLPQQQLQIQVPQQQVQIQVPQQQLYPSSPSLSSLAPSGSFSL